VVVVSAGTLMLAISALSRNSRLVGATWVGVWVVGNVTAGVLTQTVKRDWCPLVSYTANLDSLREELLGVGEARQEFVALWESGRRAGRESARAALPFGRNRRRRCGDVPPPPQHERPATGRPGSDDEDDRPPWLRTPEHLRHPWTWSAGVLAGLFAVSALTLTTRVKTLDRLR
jgi:ABC-2 type transport system permease protein